MDKRNLKRNFNPAIYNLHSFDEWRQILSSIGIWIDSVQDLIIKVHFNRGECLQQNLQKRDSFSMREVRKKKNSNAETLDLVVNYSGKQQTKIKTSMTFQEILIL